MTAPAGQLIDPAPRALWQEGQTLFPASGSSCQSPGSFREGPGSLLPARNKGCGEARSLVLHHKSFRGSLGNILPQQISVDLHQKSSARELARADSRQKNLSRAPGEVFSVAYKGCFAANQTCRVPGQSCSDAGERCSASEKLCRALGWVVLMQMTGGGYPGRANQAPAREPAVRGLKSDSSDAALLAREFIPGRGGLQRFVAHRLTARLRGVRAGPP
jgi:hypothetical protein